MNIVISVVLILISSKSLTQAGFNSETNLENVQLKTSEQVLSSIIIKAVTAVLWNALENKDIVKVKKALQNGADITTRNEAGYTTLTYAVYNCPKEIVEVLLLHDPHQINVRDVMNQSAIHYAIQEPEMVEYLLFHGADPNLGHSTDQNILEYAESKQKRDASYISEDISPRFTEGCKRNIQAIDASIKRIKDYDRNQAIARLQEMAKVEKFKVIPNTLISLIDSFLQLNQTHTTDYSRI